MCHTLYMCGNMSHFICVRKCGTAERFHPLNVCGNVSHLVTCQKGRTAEKCHTLYNFGNVSEMWQKIRTAERWHCGKLVYIICVRKCIIFQKCGTVER